MWTNSVAVFSALGKITIHTEYLKIGWKIILDYPQSQGTNAALLPMLPAVIFHMIDAEESSFAFAAASALRTVMSEYSVASIVHVLFCFCSTGRPHILHMCFYSAWKMPCSARTFLLFSAFLRVFESY